jgi:hypothetical protein
MDRELAVDREKESAIAGGAEQRRHSSTYGVALSAVAMMTLGI